MSILPVIKRGRRSKASEIELRAQKNDFSEHLMEIQTTIGFKVSARGWCYQLENAGLIHKGEFDKAEALINDLRKDPESPLPLDFTAEDEGRNANGIVEAADCEPEYYAQGILSYAHSMAEDFTPVTLAEHTGVHVECVVEKLDLRTLFSPVCAEYQIPILNARGQIDINARLRMIRRFQGSPAGTFVILYCGDHDPKGIQLAKSFVKGLHDLYPKCGGIPEITCEHIGLHKDFVDEMGFPWIDGLITGGKDANKRARDLSDTSHPDHRKPYVQSYLSQFGAKKCEANALVTAPKEGRQLIRDAISGWIFPDVLNGYQSYLEQEQRKCMQALTEAIRAA